MDDGRWTMDAGRWTLDDGRWTMDAGRWTLDVHRPGFSICAKTWTMDDFYLATAVSTNSVSGYHFVTIPGLKISSFTGPSDKMSDEVEFGSDQGIF